MLVSGAGIPEILLSIADWCAAWLKLRRPVACWPFRACRYLVHTTR